MAVLPAQHNMSLMRKLTGHVLLERLRCSGAIVCAFPSRWPMDHSKGCGYSFNYRLSQPCGMIICLKARAAVSLVHVLSSHRLIDFNPVIAHGWRLIARAIILI
jgi:hypothetical protein